MKSTKLQHSSLHDWLKVEESWRPRSKQVEFKAGRDVARKKKGGFYSDQQSPSRRMSICLRKKRVKGKSLKSLVPLALNLIAQRVKENMWSGSFFCNFKSLPGLVSILSFPILPLLLLSLFFTSIQKAQVIQFMAEAVWTANVRWRDACPGLVGKGETFQFTAPPPPFIP